MKTCSFIYMFFAMALLTVSCSTEEKDKSEVPKESTAEERRLESTAQLSRDSVLGTIKTAEKNLLSRAKDKPLDAAAANAVISLYDNFLKSFPNDSVEPGILFKAGELTLNTNRSKAAIDYFERITRKYPENKRAPHALYLTAFVYDNQLNDDKEALKIYNSFLKKYPGHQLTETVEQSIALLGKSDAQIIQSFESKNKK